MGVAHAFQLYLLTFRESLKHPLLATAVQELSWDFSLCIAVSSPSKDWELTKQATLQFKTATVFF
jgi:hypothetical protein